MGYGLVRDKKNKESKIEILENRNVVITKSVDFQLSVNQ